MKKVLASVMTRSMKDLRKFIHNHYMCDSPLTNGRFTWSNGQNPPIMSHLDRFMVSPCWEELFPFFTQEIISKIALGHWPVLFSTSNMRIGPFPFRFKNMWTLHHSFKDNV